LPNRFGSYHSDAGNHLFDVTGYCTMLAPECFLCTRICSLFRHHWVCLLFRFSYQVPTRSMGADCIGICFYNCHVCLALRHTQKVRIWCSKQGFHQLAAWHRSKHRHCTSAWCRPYTYRSSIRHSCHFLPLCDQPASFPSDPSLSLHQTRAGSAR